MLVSESSAMQQLRRRSAQKPQLVPADDTGKRDYMGYLANYYDEVVAGIGDLKKRTERGKVGVRIVAMETADKND